MRKPITQGQKVYDFITNLCATATGMIAVVIPFFVQAMGWANVTDYIVWTWGCFAIALIFCVDTEVKWRKREENFKKWLARRAAA